VPKVIVLHQRQLLHAARAVAQHHRLDSNDVGFNPLPLFHVNAEVVGLLASLWAGSELVLDDRFHRTGFWEVMGRHQVTWINAVPAIINRLATTGPVASIPRSIRFVRSASAPLPLATLRRFEEATGLPVLETYGMTEAAGQITANPIDGPRKPGSVGRPVDIELRIVVEPDVGRSGSSSRAGIDQTGHVEIRGRSVDPHPGPFIGEGPGGNAGRVGGGWLRTGDLGRLDADGYLFLQGRRDDVINRGGEKVFPREIEEAISEDPRVIDTAVVAEDDDALGQVPVAYLTVDGVTGRADARRALAVAGDVRDRLSESLPRSKRPSALHVVTGLAATATGKVVRRSLPADDLETVVTLDLR
jgi:acyl-CoA synthetase (AMP-forming)/AMP-acid ligase II